MFTRTLSSILAALALLGVAAPAQAAQAHLVSCNSTSSVTGRLVYVGVYEYGGQRFTYTFPTYCPYTVEIY